MLAADSLLTEPGRARFLRFSGRHWTSVLHGLHSREDLDPKCSPYSLGARRSMLRQKWLNLTIPPCYPASDWAIRT